MKNTPQCPGAPQVSRRETLEARRRAYNEYCASTVYPILRLGDDKGDELSHEDIARRIGDPSVRSHYCELAVELLDANIAYHRPDATHIVPSKRRTTWVVASTLAVAGLALHFHEGPVALGLAAVWCWVAGEVAWRRARDVIEQAQVHNEMVAEWAETLAGWEESRRALRAVLSDTGDELVRPA